MASESEPYIYKPLKQTNENGIEIRILTILPGRNNSPIRCTLKIERLNGSPPYQALSYVWADNTEQDPEERFLPDGTTRLYPIELELKTFFITYNLNAALKELRDETNPLALWVDAICINQNDLKERSQQVTHMAEIYEIATGVISWLGAENDQTHIAFDIMFQICWFAKLIILFRCSLLLKREIWDITLQDVLGMMKGVVLWEDNPEWHLKYPFEPDLMAFPVEWIYRAFDLTPIDFSALQPFQNLARIPFADQCDSILTTLALKTFGSDSFAFRLLASESQSRSAHGDMYIAERHFNDRQYWRRRWILQEITKARNGVIACGLHRLEYCLSFLLFSLRRGKNEKNYAGQSFKKSGIDLLSGFTSYYPMITLWPDRDAGLGANLQRHVSAECTEPRDVVYALVGISTASCLEVNYEKSLSTIFTEVTQNIIEQERDLDILFAIQQRKYFYKDDFSNIEEAFPSWVTHFALPAHSMHMSFLASPYGNRHYHAAGKELIRDLIAPPDKRMLHINSYFHGSILSIYTGDSWSLDALSSLISWNKNSQALKQTTTSGYQRFNIRRVWKTIVHDKYWDHGEIFRMGRNDISELNFSNDVTEALKGEAPGRLQRLLSICCSSKQLCMISTGALAMLPYDAKEGDLIYAVCGSSCPFVLRPTTNDEPFRKYKEELGVIQYYNFIGAGYVEGIMDGEILEEAEKGIIKKESMWLI